MDQEPVQASLQAAELCLTEGLWDSAVSRAYYALFQAAICALESRGLRRREWTHKGVHSDFVQHFVLLPKQLIHRHAPPGDRWFRIRHLAAPVDHGVLGLRRGDTLR